MTNKLIRRESFIEQINERLHNFYRNTNVYPTILFLDSHTLRSLRQECFGLDFSCAEDSFFYKKVKIIEALRPCPFIHVSADFQSL